MGMLSAAENAHAARYVTMVKSGSGGVSPGGTFYIGTQTLGESNIQTLFFASLSSNFGSPEEALLLRNQMIPAEGIPGIDKRAKDPNGSGIGFQVYHQETCIWGVTR